MQMTIGMIVLALVVVALLLALRNLLHLALELAAGFRRPRPRAPMPPPPAPRQGECEYCGWVAEGRAQRCVRCGAQTDPSAHITIKPGTVITLPAGDTRWA